jgi:hypothetical protein
MKYLFLGLCMLFYSFNSYSIESIVQKSKTLDPPSQQNQQTNKIENYNKIKRSSKVVVNRKKEKTITIRYYTEDDCD